VAFTVPLALVHTVVLIPMKSPRRTEMIAPPDSDMMSPPGPVPRWRLDCWHRAGAVVNLPFD
jgi:hypothetical protein